MQALKNLLAAYARKRRTATVSFPLQTVWSRMDDQAEPDAIRLGNQLISAHGDNASRFRRDQIVKVIDLETGRFVLGYARGCGENRQFASTVALNYDQRLQLGLTEQVTKNQKLVVLPADVLEREYFYMYTQGDRRDRGARGYAVIGLFLGTIGFLPTAAGWVSGLAQFIYGLFV